jgi:hypothetical protein
LHVVLVEPEAHTTRRLAHQHGAVPVVELALDVQAVGEKVLGTEPSLLRRGSGNKSVSSAEDGREEDDDVEEPVQRCLLVLLPWDGVPFGRR